MQSITWKAVSIMNVLDQSVRFNVICFCGFTNADVIWLFIVEIHDKHSLFDVARVGLNIGNV